MQVEQIDFVVQEAPVKNRVFDNRYVKAE